MGFRYYHRIGRMDTVAICQEKPKTMIFTRILILVWAIFLSFLLTSWLGSTHILSGNFQIQNIGLAARGIFIALTVLFALVFYLLVPRKMTTKIKVAALLPPLLFFIFCVL